MPKDKPEKKYKPINFISLTIFSTGYKEILPQGHSKSVFIPLNGELVSTHQEYDRPACSPNLVADIKNLATRQVTGLVKVFTGLLEVAPNTFIFLPRSNMR